MTLCAFTCCLPRQSAAVGYCAVQAARRLTTLAVPVQGCSALPPAKARVSCCVHMGNSLLLDRGKFGP